MASKLSTLIRELVVIGSSVAACGCAYLIYRYWKQRDARSIDEGFEDVSRLQEELATVRKQLESIKTVTTLLQSSILSCYEDNVALQELLAVPGISNTITPFNDASDQADLSLHEDDGQTASALQFSGQLSGTQASLPRITVQAQREDLFKISIFTQLEDNPEKRVLVLGLNNSGKSTLLNQVTTGSTDVKTVKPTEGFRVTSLQNKDVSLNIWEIGGGPNVRPYWSNFLQDTDLLVFVVDAADDHNLPLAFRELKSLLGDERLAHVPLLIIANKQDLPNAKKCEEIADILDLNSIPSSKHKVRVLGTIAIPSAEIARHPSILEVQHALFIMTNA